MKRPLTTLFLLSSVDGKISIGDTDALDFDKDLPRITGVKEGLRQYYDLEKKTDFWSFNTGRVLAKVGANKKKNPVKNRVLRFVVVDNKPHLTRSGLLYLSGWLGKLFVVTTNKNHPAFEFAEKNGNVVVLYYPHVIDFVDLFSKLCGKHACKRLTIQSGGSMNAVLLRKGLIDRVSIVVAPVLVGGKDTTSMVDGESLHSVKDLVKARALKLRKCSVLKNSYLHLLYDVDNNTKIR